MATTMIWTFDSAGNKSDVVAALTKKTFDSVVQDTDDLIAEKRLLLRIDAKNQATIDRLSSAEEVKSLLADPVERAAYDRARAYVLGELEACKSTRVGVTMRSMLDFDKMEPAQPHVRVHVDVTEY